MGKYYITTKYKTLMSLLNSLGVQVKGKGDHRKMVSKNGRTWPVPKKHSYLSNGVVEGICDFLIREGYEEEALDRFVP